MFFSLAVAIGATILWINQWLADFINAKINPYTVSPEDKEKDNFKAKLMSKSASQMAFHSEEVITAFETFFFVTVGFEYNEAITVSSLKFITAKSFLDLW